MSKENLDAGREWMRAAWHELNAIRARDGAPDGVSQDWWDEITDALAEMLGDETVPWMTKAAKLLVAPYESRVAAAEAEEDRLQRALENVMWVLNGKLTNEAIETLKAYVARAVLGDSP